MKTYLVPTCVSLAALLSSGMAVAQSADMMFTGGQIVTLNDDHPTADTEAVGGRDEINKAHNTAATKVVDFGGKTLLPGFLDAHSIGPRLIAPAA